jgi:hypothetical protein
LKVKKTALTAIAIVALLGLLAVASCKKNQQVGGQTGSTEGSSAQSQDATPQAPGEDEQSSPADSASKEDAQQPDAAENVGADGAAELPAAGIPPGPTPPYITLGVQTKPGEISFCEGQPVPLYYELAEDTPETCWVALVKRELTSTLCGDHSAGALTKKQIRGSKMGQLLFIMPTPGLYILRLFASEDEQGEAIGESQPFRVMSKEDWYGNPGGENPPVAK